MPLNGESKELDVAALSRFVEEVESARRRRGVSEDRVSVRRSVRELRVREAIAKMVVVG
jgi:hypothetical protein